MFKYLTLLMLIAMGSLHVYAAKCPIDHLRPNGTYLERIPELCTVLLENRDVGAVGAVAIASALMEQKDHSVEELHLAYAEIGDVGAAAIAKMLRKNRSLIVLDLRDNKITNKGMIAIANALLEQQDHRFKELYLGSNEIGIEGLKKLEELKKKYGDGVYIRF